MKNISKLFLKKKRGVFPFLILIPVLSTLLGAIGVVAVVETISIGSGVAVGTCMGKVMHQPKTICVKTYSDSKKGV